MNRFRPVTAASASTRVCGRPTTVNRSRGLRFTETRSLVRPAAFPESSPIPALRPSGADTTPPSSVNSSALVPNAWAAVASSRCRATAAATRTGV